jgi:hypothetical protein
MGTNDFFYISVICMTESCLFAGRGAQLNHQLVPASSNSKFDYLISISFPFEAQECRCGYGNWVQETQVLARSVNLSASFFFIVA